MYTKNQLPIGCTIYFPGCMRKKRGAPGLVTLLFFLYVTVRLNKNIQIFVYGYAHLPLFVLQLGGIFWLNHPSKNPKILVNSVTPHSSIKYFDDLKLGILVTSMSPFLYFFPYIQTCHIVNLHKTKVNGFFYTHRLDTSHTPTFTNDL